MNRNLMLGIATFLAIVGIALTGGDNQAEAGFGCGGKRAGGGLLSRLHARGGDCGCPAPDPCPPPAPAPVCCPEPPPTCGGASAGCGGGLFAKLRAKHAARKAARKACAPDPCCEPAPEPCCAPAPAPEPCCAPAPAPEPCCAPAPAPVAPAPCCGAAPAMAAPVAAAAPCCGSGEVVYGGDAGGAAYSEGVPTDAMPMDAYGGGATGESYILNEAGEQIVPGSVQVTNDGSGAAEAAVEAATDGI